MGHQVSDGVPGSLFHGLAVGPLGLQVFGEGEGYHGEQLRWSRRTRGFGTECLDSLIHLFGEPAKVLALAVGPHAVPRAGDLHRDRASFLLHGGRS